MTFVFLDNFSHWLEATALSRVIVQTQWTWPICETLHFIGLALLIGTVGLADLRMLGMARAVHFEGLHRLIRWGIAGFVICVITGTVFFIGAPFQYVHNVIFQLKLLFILLAGINALVFEFKVLPTMGNLGPGEAAPPAAKVIAASSLFLWVGVMFLGRMLPFLGEAF
jgi:hypothetical protein